MKTKLLLPTSLIVCISFFSLNVSSFSSVFAHSTQLEIVYDECVPVNYSNSNNIGDGEDEKWYELASSGNQLRHFPHSSSVTDS